MTEFGDRRPASGRSKSKYEVDQLVLGTTNAPYKRSITPSALAESLASGNCEPWTVHVVNFFNDVNPELVFRLAEAHGISTRTLASTYRALKAATGEGNPALEAVFDRLASEPYPNFAHTAWRRSTDRTRLPAISLQTGNLSGITWDLRAWETARFAKGHDA